MEKTEVGECSGSFGELLQGVLPDGKKFLINLRIQNKSIAHVTLTNSSYDAEKESGFAKSYALFSKSHKVVRNILADLGRHDDVFLNIESTIPVGKGLSSSTADMVASVRALQKALSIGLQKQYIGRMLTEIEPNDGLHFDATSAYHHTTGELIANWDWVPNWRILGLDLGGVVDTVKFNLRRMDISVATCDEYADLLEQSKVAMARQDRSALGKIARRSAELWQAVNPKSGLEEVLQFSDNTGAEGVANAHSGTYLGLLYSDSRADWGALAQLAEETFPGVSLHWYDTISCRAEPEIILRPRD